MPLSSPHAHRTPLLPTTALWAVGGGKGGVGRSLLTANMGIHLARHGRTVVVADFDLGGANLHGYLGVRRITTSLADLLDGRSSLASLLVDTSVPGLKLLPGVQGTLPASDRPPLIKAFQQGITGLSSDIVLLDCGSGRSPETLELVRASSMGILVGTPEPISIESLYLFTESLLTQHLENELPTEAFERLERTRHPETEAGEALSFRAAFERLRGQDEDSCNEILSALRTVKLRLILNQVRTESEGELARILKNGFEKLFGLELYSISNIDYDLSVLQSLQKKKPLSQQYPNAAATLGVEKAVTSLLASVSQGGSAAPPLSIPLAELDHYRMLEVSPGASSKEIQQAYELSRRSFEPESPFRHPFLGQAEAEGIRELVETAYRTLIFLETRTEYDRRLISEGLLRPEETRSRPLDDSDTAEPDPHSVEAGSVSATPPASDEDPQDGAPLPLISDAAPGRGMPVTGASLREYRQARGLSLEAIVEKTKIRGSILAALEEDRFEDLPEPVFLKAFLRQLAACLSLDPEIICREYMGRPQQSVDSEESRD